MSKTIIENKPAGSHIKVYTKRNKDLSSNGS